MSVTKTRITFTTPITIQVTRTTKPVGTEFPTTIPTPCEIASTGSVVRTRCKTSLESEAITSFLKTPILISTKRKPFLKLTRFKVAQTIQREPWCNLFSPIPRRSLIPYSHRRSKSSLSSPYRQKTSSNTTSEI